jgi:hypothetical protein
MSDAHSGTAKQQQKACLKSVEDTIFDFEKKKGQPIRLTD